MASPITAAIWSENTRPARVWPRAATAGTAGHAQWRLMLSTWLLLAMVLAQTMGFVHGTAHVHPPHAGHLPSGVIAADAAGRVAAALEQLFDDHDDEARCRLYDQMSRGECAPTADMAGAASMPVVATPADAAIPWPCGDCLPARARGPPSAG